MDKESKISTPGKVSMSFSQPPLEKGNELFHPPETYKSIKIANQPQKILTSIKHRQKIS